MKILQEEIKARLCEILKDHIKIDPANIQFSIPPNRNFGDLSTTLPFVLAKREKRKPFLIGKDIIEKIEDKFDIFSHIKLEGGGFINFTFKENFLLNYLRENILRKIPAKQKKVVVEHTSINPNKAAHIGHLRNSCLGDTLGRSLKFLNYEVEIQNYLDDTGIQVADVVWGLMNYKALSYEEIQKIDNLATELWELYPEVSGVLSENEEAKISRDEVHRKIEEKVDPEYKVSNYIAQQVLEDHIRVMELLNIRYDLLVRESDIIDLDFFTAARQLLESKKLLYPSKDTTKKGCFVIKYEKENLEKIIIRSNGTITYIGKDIAYTFWKVGLFKKDFYYKKFFTYKKDNKEIFITDFVPNKHKYNYGSGECVYNVIGVGQSYLQNIISQILDTLSPSDQTNRFIHFSYEMVALTPNCVQELGFELSEEEKNKAFVEVSGRKGIAVKADDLINKLVEKSLLEVNKRDPQMPKDKAQLIAKKIAIGALRYFMIKFNSNSVIAFDFKEALAFEGDTGPYLQYTMVRINSILKKLGDGSFPLSHKSLDTSLLEKKEYDVYHEILLELSLLELQIELAISNHELSSITNYAYSICQKVNHFYHLFPIISEKNLKLKMLRLSLILLVKSKLEILFSIMGIPIPEKM
jgi:arginyl-tRNA synthetase